MWLNILRIWSYAAYCHVCSGTKNGLLVTWRWPLSLLLVYSMNVCVYVCVCVSLLVKITIYQMNQRIRSVFSEQELCLIFGICCLQLQCECLCATWVSQLRFHYFLSDTYFFYPQFSHRNAIFQLKCIILTLHKNTFLTRCWMLKSNDK